MSSLLRRLPELFERRHRRFLRFYLLLYLAKFIAPGYRLKVPDMDWWDDDGFNRYLVRFGEYGWLNTERRWMLHQLLRLVSQIPGDTAECGVFKGASSFLICSANTRSSHDKTHHVFDSFEGLSQPKAADGSYWEGGDLAVGLEIVREALSDFNRVAYHKGWIPDRFPDVADLSFSFVHVDVDLYEPTRDSISFFYPRLNDGGILLCDDYGGGSCPGATRAIDEFLADKPEKMLSLVSCGGFLIKGQPTASDSVLI